MFAPHVRRFMHAHAHVDNAPLLRTCNARACYGVVHEYDDTKIVKSRRSGFSRGKLEAGRNELGLCTARYESKSCC